MTNEREKIEAEIAKLSALSEDGIKVPMAGKTLTLYPVSWLKVKAMKNRLFSITEGFKSIEKDPTVQTDAILDAAREVLAELFTNERRGQRVTPEDFNEATDPDIRAVCLAFNYLNEGMVELLGKVLAPQSPSLHPQITEQISN